MEKRTVKIEFAERPLTITVGEMAKQADGSVLVQYAETAVLVTAVAGREEVNLDFLPLTVNYQEMSYAAGRFPGGFFKREGRPSDREILISRLIDRPLRPLFPKGFNREIQIIATVLSADQENDPAILGIIGASCALTLSQIPFDGPIAGVKIGRKNGSFIVNPTTTEMEESDMEIVVAGTKDAIIMVEGGAKFVKGEDIIEAIDFGHKSLLPLIELQERLKEELKVEKWIFVEQKVKEELRQEIKERKRDEIYQALTIPEKKKRREKIREIKEATIKEYADIEESIMARTFDEILGELMREKLLSTGLRIDGRRPDELREITCRVGIFPRTHGSALFTRGETQALAITTFGTSEDEQKVESLLEGEVFKAFMVHYNFPPFSVGEVAPLRAPTRREIGHGYLAERALSPILPSKDEFPYTIRIVSEILESNGSSSMATVCSGCLSLMDAGVPIKEMVAGIAMGLVKEKEKEIILSDILGDEDHLGDMDFKIAGSKNGFTAIQMDLKTKGITKDTLVRVVNQAKKGIEEILSVMRKTIDKPRENLSPYAPRILTIKINPEKIRDVIGPGGKVIKTIIDQTGVKIDIEDSGVVRVASQNEAQAMKAIEMIKEVAREVEVGAVYEGKVKRIVDSGVIVEIWPGSDGFVHISQLADGYIRRITDIVKEGDIIPVKVMEIDQFGRIKLSRKAALKEKKR